MRELRSYLLEYKPHIYNTLLMRAYGTWDALTTNTAGVSRQSGMPVDRGFVYTFSGSGDGSNDFSSIIVTIVALGSFDDREHEYQRTSQVMRNPLFTAQEVSWLIAEN
jgi:hypothetical protein